MAKVDYSEEDIEHALREVGLADGDSIFVHSNIGFFGVLEGAREKRDYYDAFKKAIFNVVGRDGTLVVPTFSYSFCWKKPFSVKDTESKCGFFSEMVRLDPSALRSEDANFSVAAIGKRAKEFTEKATEHSFGAGSFWEKFLDAGGKFCNFNFDSASTFIHYVEKRLDVPYRYDKGFDGIFIGSDAETKRRFYHFVYDTEKPNHAPDFTKFDRKARETQLAKMARIGKGSIVCISANDAFALIKNELGRDPAFLIKGPL